MGWEQKDAVGELLQKGDRGKGFRNLCGDGDWRSIGGECGGAVEIDDSSYVGKFPVRVHTDSGRFLWVHHMSVMKV